MLFQTSMFSDQARPDINSGAEELTGKQRPPVIARGKSKWKES